jgi:hypothetical protein
VRKIERRRTVANARGNNGKGIMRESVSKQEGSGSQRNTTSYRETEKLKARENTNDSDKVPTSRMVHH